MEAVSIIMKVWNASRYVKLCLETLLENTNFPYELIIVDNGSKPRLVEYLRQKARQNDQIHLVENQHNMGPGYANRQGWAAASHSVLCLLDSDVLLPAGWLGRLVEEFFQNPQVKMLSAMQHEESIFYPFPLEHTDSRQAWYEVERQHRLLSPLEQFLIYTKGLSLEDFDKAIREANRGNLKLISAPPDFLSTFCTLVDADFVQKVGGIAAVEFQGYGSEDVDLCWRVGDAGGMVAKSARVYVHHFQGSSLEDNRLDRQAALARANRILYGKWKNRLLELVAQNILVEGHDPVEYLESHFIFTPLAEHTGFIEDVREKLKTQDIPEDIVWRPGIK
jgi:GT2 family glycosyltransferase